ncbi:MAG TPA: Trm112 family protein [Aquabacterium sp.]|nr:Trm112 family protein [Aquabacterium sp.]
MDTRLVELLVCPVCKGPLHRLPQGQHLICRADRLAFPIRDGIPVMLENEAIHVDENDQPVETPTAAPGA